MQSYTKGVVGLTDLYVDVGAFGKKEKDRRWLCFSVIWLFGVVIFLTCFTFRISMPAILGWIIILGTSALLAEAITGAIFNLNHLGDITPQMVVRHTINNLFAGKKVDVRYESVGEVVCIIGLTVDGIPLKELEPGEHAWINRISETSGVQVAIGINA